jgi:hypothetical protein
VGFSKTLKKVSKIGENFLKFADEASKSVGEFLKALGGLKSTVDFPNP